MPRSKRDRDVSLTKVKKKTREFKNNLIEQIRQCVNSYSNVFLYTFENMRGTEFVQVRQKYKRDSRFFFGKNNVMALALGRTAQDEANKDLHKISGMLKGQCGLMFTNQDASEVIQYFEEFEADDYARSGQQVDQEVLLNQGPLPQFPHSIEPQLRALGLPTKILKLLDMKLTAFRVHLLAHWSKETGFKEL